MSFKIILATAIVALAVTGAAQANAAGFALDNTSGPGRSVLQVSPVVGNDWSRNPFQL